MFETVRPIDTPEEILARVALPPALAAIKAERDALVRGVVSGQDKRMLLIIGPCSADNPAAVVEYVTRLGRVQPKVSDKLVIVPRIYTGKPRTRGEGYKGFVHQPDPHKPTDIAGGIVALRRMHFAAIEASGLTAADEMLYPDNYAYVADLLTYVTVGARSSENQQHRLVASGVEVPLGIKNTMYGSVDVLLNSIHSAQIANEFKYNAMQVRTTGNPFAHAVLRGMVDVNGFHVANYHYEDVVRFSEKYVASGLSNPSIVIDVNHSNSGKNYAQQPRIIREILNNRRCAPEYGALLRGFMVESYLEDGAQSVDGGVFGRSITDSCLGWSKTERLIYDIAEAL